MENDNAPPSTAQQFTNEAPRTGGIASLPEGAQKFIRSYLPEHDEQGVNVSFEIVQEYKPFKSKPLQEKAIEEGREPDASCDVYEPVIYIRKTVPGNDKLEVHRPVFAQDKRQFPYAWQEFMKTQSTRVAGTPLSAMGLDAGMIRALEGKNLQTVEALAAVNDAWIFNLGTGGRDLRKRAGDYLKGRANEGSANEMAELREQLSKALNRIEQLEAEPAKRGPGRPPKAAEAG